MDIVSSNFLPGDPRLVDQIVCELKSQGIFDQFRKECISDVDTKPAYQNLRQRVEGSVMSFLQEKKFSADSNKNQLREKLRKNITESGFLEAGVERIVDQVVNPKISSVFLPKVEEVVYRFLGLQQPEVKEAIEETKPKIEMLPTDLEAVSPEPALDESLNSSGGKKEDHLENNTSENSHNNSETKTDDESPSFEPLEENTQEETSKGSNLSIISGELESSQINDTEGQTNLIDSSQKIPNDNASLSVPVGEVDSKMDICENSTASENSDKLEIFEAKSKPEAPDEKMHDSASKEISRGTEHDNRKVEEKNKDESKKPHDRHKSSRSDKSKKDDRDKRERSKSESKSKDKTSSRHSSSSKDKDRREQANGKDTRVEKEKYSKKDHKERDKSKDDKSNKEKSDRDRTEKEKSSKDKDSNRDKSRTDADKQRDKSKSEKERNKSSSHKSKDKLSSSAKKDDAEKDKHRTKEERKDKSSRDKSSSNKEKDKSTSSSSKHKESSKSSKDRSKSSSSSAREKERSGDKRGGDSKPRSDKHSKSDKDKSASHEKSLPSSRKEKDKGSTADDHYGFKNKTSDRRSTDRDSNDGSGKVSKSSSLGETAPPGKSEGSKESSESFTSGSGDSGSNSDKVEKGEDLERADGGDSTQMVPAIKYIKPKFASNIQEAMRLMKIRKQLSKLERQNQLSLTQVERIGGTTEEDTNRSANSKCTEGEMRTFEVKHVAATQEGAIEDIPVLKSHDLSMETFEALEARLAQEMSNIGEHMYGDGDEDYECSAITISSIKKRKLTEENDAEGIAFKKPKTAVYSDAKVEKNSALEKVVIDEKEPYNKTAEQKVFKEEFKGFSLAEQHDEIIEKYKILIAELSQYIAHLQEKSTLAKVDTKHNFDNISEINEKCPVLGFKPKNGDNLFVKISKMNSDLSTKIPDQPLDVKCSSIDVVKKTLNTPTKIELELINTKQNGQVCSTLQAEQSSEAVKWGNDDFSCCFFDKAAVELSEAHAEVMRREVARLEALIKQRSLWIQNNAPKLKRPIKRKVQGSENNNSINLDYTPPMKKALLGDANSNQTNKESLCNTNVSSHQDFSLPLSPAESEKSSELKKEEPVMVKPKRGSTTKRYSSEDLYKPRPVLSCTTRRRSGRLGSDGKT